MQLGLLPKISSGVSDFLDAVFPDRKIVSEIVGEIISDGIWNQRHERDTSGKKVVDIDNIIKAKLKAKLGSIESERISELCSDVRHKALKTSSSTSIIGGKIS